MAMGVFDGIWQREDIPGREYGINGKLAWDLLCLSFVLVDFGESSPGYFSLICFGMLRQKIDVCCKQKMGLGLVLF
ncbi:hypothetical protein L873DRAFT_1822077 [Choiromyces venosus 120613-1]|uniref:Uncharacterized protein n=1 Tax=Choiromyces venosus 120613-1 TaxID=1336337 RepID=A0A3N4IUI8_9PEZI|nr:hypothetical protein L873DRAFT_1822077 [Choiromyces venosus 120613-1]